MFTPISKMFAALSGISLVAAIAYNIDAMGDGKLITVLFVTMVVLGVALCAGAVAARDGDSTADPSMAGGDAAAASVSSASASYWPAVSALGFVFIGAGLIVGRLLVILGLLVLLGALFEWGIQGWADRATSDPVASRALRHKLMNPIEVPLSAGIAVLVIVLSFSRIFLSLETKSAAFAFIGFGVMVLGIAVLLAFRPNLRRAVVTGIVSVASVGVLAGGIAGASSGERQFGNETATCKVFKAVKDKLDTCEIVLQHKKGKVEFRQTKLIVVAGVPFKLVLLNEDEGVSHNFKIVGLDIRTVPAEGKSELDVVITEPGTYTYISEDNPNIKGELKVLS